MLSTTTLLVVFGFLTSAFAENEWFLEEYTNNINAIAYPEHNRIRRQVFGGVNHRPGGGRQQTFGYQGSNGWGSLSQSFDRNGFSRPIVYSGGVGGQGLSGSLTGVPGIGGQGSIRGQAGLLNTPNHQVNAWAQHDRNLDKNLRPIGRPTNSGGLQYQHQNGASAYLSGSHTPGGPKTGQVGGSIPLYNQGNTNLGLNGNTNFGQGFKPSRQVGLELNHKF